MQHDITNTEVFKPLEAFIRTEEYSDGDLLNLIGSFIGIAPHVAQAMAFHSRDIIEEFGESDLAYTDIVVQVYWRTFFSPAHAGKYGTDSMVHDQPALEQFARFACDPDSVDAETLSEVKHALTTATKH